MVAAVGWGERSRGPTVPRPPNSAESVLRGQGLGHGHAPSLARVENSASPSCLGPPGLQHLQSPLPHPCQVLPQFTPQCDPDQPPAHILFGSLLWHGVSCPRLSSPLRRSWGSGLGAPHIPQGRYCHR